MFHIWQVTQTSIIIGYICKHCIVNLILNLIKIIGLGREIMLSAFSEMHPNVQLWKTLVIMSA